MHSRLNFIIAMAPHSDEEYDQVKSGAVQRILNRNREVLEAKSSNTYIDLLLLWVFNGIIRDVYKPPPLNKAASCISTCLLPSFR